MSLPITVPPARGAGMTKSPVTGLRRFSRFNATSEMQAVSVGLEHCAFGIDVQDAGVERCERGQDVLLRARPLDQLKRLRQHRDAARRRHEPGLGLRALIAAEEEEACSGASGPPIVNPPSLRRAFGLSMPSFS